MTVPGVLEILAPHIEDHTIVMRVPDADLLCFGTRTSCQNYSIGIFLEKSSLYDTVAKELRKIPEIVRLNYTTGNYSMFAEIVCKNIQQLRFVLHDELQKIKGIERTETFISLEESFIRDVRVSKASE